MLDKVKALLEKAGVDCVVFVQVSANPTSDIMEEGVRLLTEQHCDVVVALGGMNINMAGVTAPHGMEHPASGLRDIVHGRGLAALTPIIYQKSFETAPAKFDKISRLLGGKDRRSQNTGTAGGAGSENNAFTGRNKGIRCGLDDG